MATSQPATPCVEDAAFAREERLEACRLDPQPHQDQLISVLQDHQDALGQCRSLTHELDQVRRGLQQARLDLGQRSNESPANATDRRELVLVLVDASHHPIKTRYLHAGDSGGRKIAQMFVQNVSESLRRKDVQVKAGDIVVPIFATELGRPHNTGGVHGASLASFFPGFNGIHNLFDYVEAGSEANIASKMSDTLHMFTSCGIYLKHVFVAISTNDAYYRMLLPYSGLDSQFTILAGGTHYSTFKTLQLGVAEFHGFFSSDTKATGKGPPRQSSRSGTPIQPRSQPRRPSSILQAPACKPTSSVAQPQSISQAISQLERRIPINKAEQRLDVPLRPISRKLAGKYYREARGLCDDHHVHGGCSYRTCKRRHRAASPECVLIRRHELQKLPCHIGHTFRSSSCSWGHSYRRTDCDGPGDGCRMSKDFHGIESSVADWVAPNESDTAPPRETRREGLSSMQSDSVLDNNGKHHVRASSVEQDKYSSTEASPAYANETAVSAKTDVGEATWNPAFNQPQDLLDFSDSGW